VFFPAELFEMRELFPQVPRGVPFEQSRNRRGRKSRGSTDEHVNVIDIGFHRQQRQIMLLAALCKKFFRLCLNGTCQDFSSVFGYPDQMVPDLVVTPSGFTHL